MMKLENKQFLLEQINYQKKLTQIKRVQEQLELQKITKDLELKLEEQTKCDVITPEYKQQV